MAPREEEKDLDIGQTPENTQNANEKIENYLETLKTAGLKRIEAIVAGLTKSERLALYFLAFILGFSYYLDGKLRRTFTGFATASFSKHSLLSTISVLQSIFGAAVQPAAAKLCDLGGRAELFILGMTLYVIGTILEASSNGVQVYAAGSCLYSMGYTILLLAVAIILADLSSLRYRQLITFLPAYSGLISPWISAPVTNAILDRTTWRWGIGMFAIILPAIGACIVGILFNSERRARKNNAIPSLPPRPPLAQLSTSLFWQMDIIGTLCLVLAIGLFLTPLTLAKGSTDAWKDGKYLAPCIIGFILFFVFILWERRCQYPLFPLAVMKDRGVWAGMALTVTKLGAFELVSTYLIPLLIVAFNRSAGSATMIGSVWGFCSTITGLLTGLLALKLRRIKIFIVVGCGMFVIAFGLFVRYRGTVQSLPGLIAAEAIIGLANGFLGYVITTAMQARVNHDQLAMVTAAYNVVYSNGIAFGSAIAGAVWAQRMPAALVNNIGDEKIASQAFNDPYTVAKNYPWGTPIRQGFVEAYMSVQLVLAYIGLGLAILTLVFGLLMRDTYLGDEKWHEKKAVEEDLEDQVPTLQSGKVPGGWAKLWF